jgi:hypothetical protein
MNTSRNLLKVRSIGTCTRMQKSAQKDAIVNVDRRAIGVDGHKPM